MKIERKIYAFIISMILLGVIIGSIYADRTITDTSDDVYTKIRCSNGNVYDATAANIQIALNNNRGTDTNFYYPKGWVKLPGNTSITVTSMITIPVNTILDLGGSRLDCNTPDITVINMTRGAEIRNGLINFWSSADRSVAISVYPKRYTPSAQNYKTMIENMRIETYNYADNVNVGLYLHTNGPSQSITFVVADNIRFERLYYGIMLNATGGTGTPSGTGTYINGNMFTNLIFQETWFPITLKTEDISKNVANANCFVDYQIQCDSGMGFDVEAIHCETLANYFNGGIVWDWNGKGNAYNFTSTSGANYAFISERPIVDEGNQNIIMWSGYNTTNPVNMGWMQFPFWKPRVFYQSTEPAIPDDCVGFWVDSDDSKYYLILDYGGVQKKVELT